MIFIADLIACSTCFGHHYAHHQELESIIQVAAACGIWCFGFQAVGIVWSWSLCVRFAGSMMMGIMVSETCWASNKICNKNRLLHLVGILFPHINDDARSKSHKKRHNECTVHVLVQTQWAFLPPNNYTVPIVFSSGLKNTRERRRRHNQVIEYTGKLTPSQTDAYAGKQVLWRTNEYAQTHRHVEQYGEKQTS